MENCSIHVRKSCHIHVIYMLYTCKEFEFFMYLIDEIVTRKIFMNWSEFKVRHIEMLFILFFIVLVNLFD